LEEDDNYDVRNIENEIENGNENENKNEYASLKEQIDKLEKSCYCTLGTFR
jgi:hypothetical protein